ncbi:MAG: UDP-glucose dehydrogenase family protein [Candidatus Nanoarchaeia archaeon]
MKIAMVGTGYVGLVTGTCLANMGHEVTCVDIDEEKIGLLKKGKTPIYEPGLGELMKRNVAEERLTFTTSLSDAVKSNDVIFIAVGTPPSENGEADLSAVFTVAKEIAKNANEHKVVVNKSTVPVGTAEKVKDIIKENIKEGLDFDVVSNPEFLKEGMAIQDFQVPDRIVIGVENGRAQKIMDDIYKDVARTNRPIIFTDVKSAELIKYASNAMLATRISFMNQLSCLCDKVGADIKEVAKGMGLDSRIGSRFLQAGIGFGGSCFPKDVSALSSTLEKHGCSADLIDAVSSINERQKLIAVRKLESVLELKNKTIAVWGISFKPKTDDIRESPALEIIKELREKGANVKVFDPVAMKNAKKELKKITYCQKPMEAVEAADALIVATEWDEFRNPDFEKVKRLMKRPLIVDGRNIYKPHNMKEMGFTYLGIGR